MMFGLVGAHATETWTNNSGNQAWGNTLNWSGTAVPTASDTIFIDTLTGSNAYPIISSGSQNGLDIYVGAFSGNPSRLDITGGSLTSNSTNTSNTGGSFVVAPDASSVATLNIANTGTTGGAFSGYGLGNGSVSTLGIFLVARSAGAVGTVNINTTGIVNVGDSNGDELQIGVSGNGTLNLDAGTVNTYSSFVIGDNSGSVGTVNVSGGAINAATTQAGKPLILGVNAGSRGTLNLTGSGIVTVTAGQEMIVGDSGTGTVIVTGGLLTATHPTEGIRLGFLAAGNGTLTLNGGTVLTTMITNGAGTGVVNFNGGTLKSSTNSSTFMSGLTAAQVMGGGAIIDTNGFGITIGQSLTSGTINDGGLTKNGAGTLTLTGASTYNGPTLVNTGTLTLAGGSLGGTSITVGPSQAATLAVSGSGAIGASGAGSLTLTTNRGSISMLDGAISTLTISNTNAGATVLAIGGGDLFNFEAGAASADEISLGSGLVAIASGANRVNITLLGRPTSSQTLTLINAPGGFTGSSDFTLGTISGASTFGLALSLQSTPTQLNLVESASNAAPATAYFTGSLGVSWSANNGTTGNFSTDSTGTSAVTALPGAATNVHLYAANANLFNIAASTLDGNFTIQSLTVDGSTLGESGSVGIAQGTGGTLTIAPLTSSSGITVNAGSGPISISAPVAIGAAQTWTNNSSNLLVVSGSVNMSGNALSVTGSANTLISGNISGVGSLTQNGPARLTLTGTDSYTGSTTISSGSLRLGNGGTSGSLAGSSAITDNGTLVFNRADTITQGSSFGPISGAGNVLQSGSGAVILNAANSYSGGTIVNSGTLLVGNSSALGSGALALNGATFGSTVAVTLPNVLTIAGSNTIGTTAQAASITLNGAMSGNGTLANNVGGSAAYTVLFGGNLSGFAGTLNYTCDTGASGVWWRVGTSSTTTDLSNASVIINAGNVTNLATQFVKDFGFTDGITNATVIIGQLSGDGIFQSSYNNSGPNTLEVGSLNTSSTFSGVIAGGNAGTNMALTKIGTGTLTLAGANLYTGTTTILNGTLQLGNGGTAGSLSPSSVINTTGTLAFNRADTISQGTAFGYTIGGSGGLAQNGAGNVILAGTNTYSGGTVINSGTLTLNASLPNTSGVTIAAPGVLQAPGSKTLGGVLNSSGVVSMTDSAAGTLTVGNISFSSSAIDLDLLSGGSDTIHSTGIATISGNNVINLQLASGQSVVTGSYVLITATGGLGSGFSVGSVPSNLFTYSLAQSTSTQEVLTISGAAFPATAYWTGAASRNGGDTANTWGFGVAPATGHSNWSTTPDGNTDPLQAPGSATNVIMTASNAAGVSGTLSTQLDGAYAIRSLTFKVPSAANINHVIMDTDGNILTLGTGGLLQDAGSAASGHIADSAATGSIVLAGSQTWANNSSSQSLAVDDPISTSASGSTVLTLGGSGAGGITLNGTITDPSAGTLALVLNQAGVSQLNGANTYSGGTLLSSGTVQVGNATAFGNGAVTFAAGSTTDLQLNGVGIGGGALQAVNLSTNAANPGTPIIESGTAGTIDTLAVSLTSSQTFAGNLVDGANGTLAVQVAGTGFLRLTGNNTYSGGTMIFGNGVTINSPNSLGSNTAANTITLQNGTIETTGSSFDLGSNKTIDPAFGTNTIQVDAGRLTMSGPISADTGNLAKTGTGSLLLSGLDAHVGNWIVSSGTLIITNTNDTYSGVLSINTGATANISSLSDYGLPSAIGDRAAGSETNATIDSASNGIGLHLAGGTLQYTGSTAQETNRQIRLAAGTDTIDASGSVPSATVNFSYSGSNTNLFDGTGARTLQLTGSNTGNNVFSIGLTDQAAGTGLTSILKSGSGTWVITGSNANTGATTITGGILRMGANNTLGSSANIGSISAGALLDLNDTAQSAGLFSGTSSGMITNLGSATSLLTVDGAAPGRFNGVIADGSGKVGLTLNSAGGTLILGGSNGYSGPTTIAAGTLAFRNAQSNIGSVTVGDGAGLTVRSFSTSQTALITRGLVLGQSGTDTVTFDLNNLANPAQAIISTGTGSLTVNAATNILLQNIIGISSGTFTLIDYSGALNGSYSSLHLTGLPLRQAGTLVNNTANTSIDVSVQQNDSPVWTGAVVSSSNTHDWDIDTTGSGTQGTANWQTLTTQVATTYRQLATGTDEVIFSDLASSSATNVNIVQTVSPNNVFVTSNTNNYTFSGNGGIAGSGGLSKSGSSTLTLVNLGANTYTGPTTINGGVLQVGTGGTNGSLPTGSAIIDNGSLILDHADTLTQGTNFSTSISGSGSLVQGGGGAVVLNVANTYTGGTVLNSGTLTVVNGSAPGTGALTLTGGILNDTGATGFATTSLANPIIVSGTATAIGTGNVGNDLALAGNITGNGSLTIRGTLNATGFELSGNNSGFMGMMTINGGNVKLESATAGSANAAWVVNGGLEADASGANTFNLGSLSGTGEVSGHFAQATGAVQTLSIGSLNSSTVFNGVIKDNTQAGDAYSNQDQAANNQLAVTKIGTGTLTLAGNNPYTGATGVNGGTLIVSGSLTGTASVTVQGAALQLASPNDLNSAARLVLVSGALQAVANMTETLSDLTLGAGASTLSLGASGDILHFTSSSGNPWTGTLAITNWNGSASGGGSDEVFFGANGASLTAGQIADITFVNPTINGAALSGNFSAVLLSSGEIVAIPEASTLSMLLGGGALLAWCRYRRRPAR